MDIETIYRKYYHEIFLYIRKLSGNADVAEEITQETFVRSLKQIDRVEGNVRAWLYAIARNAYYRYCRRNRLYSGEEPADSADPAPTVLDDLLEMETLQAAVRLAASLPEPYREVFRMRIWQEASFEEIGSRLGKSAVWARVTYFRARKMLQSRIENGNGI